MNTKQKLIPGEGHPIDVAPTGGRVIVKRNGQVIADSERALTLHESTLPDVQYIPVEDANRALLAPSDHETFCPYKGDANYYSIVLDGDRAENAVWEYQAPYPAVAAIAGHIAFYPDQVEIILA